MRRKGDKTLDYDERNIQCLIVKKNWETISEHSQVIIDVEYKLKLSKRSKTPFVDFVVIDKNDRSIGLIEFKYQGISMDPDSLNSLSAHYEDFKSMIIDERTRIVTDVKNHVNRLADYNVLKDDKIKSFLCTSDGEIKLWCGFFFLGDKSRKSKRRAGKPDSGKEIGLFDRIIDDYQDQISDENEVDLRSKQSDICEPYCMELFKGNSILS
nr:hypothetical protein [Lachnospiraceae bacterium]